MRSYLVFLNKTPVMRLLLPLIAGIIIQWELKLESEWLLPIFLFCFLLLFFYSFLSVKQKFRFAIINGIIINIMFCSAGGLMIASKDIRQNKNWFGNRDLKGFPLIVKLADPLSEKSRTWKTSARVNGWVEEGKFHSATGKILLYFKKDKIPEQVHAGSVIMFLQDPEKIKNSGNPGSFDFEEYSLFHGISHQVYLEKKDWILVSEKENAFNRFIYKTRDRVISSIKNNISGAKEKGLAEALIIGYKEDLDKDLVRSYTNTGVVHIIAISGMHLALIYGILVLITSPLKKIKKLKTFRILIIIAGLWIFSIMAGAQASVLRSALMFTCIALAELAERKTSVYNSLAVSALILLCYNPFWIWDLGFQLSYAAVLSILVFYKSIYSWISFENRLVDTIWKTLAVSIAAQIFTTPISLYYFHQFPVLFLFTNLIAVPLSTLILLGLIFLCFFSWWITLAKLTGAFCSILITWMNSYIENLEKIPFALWTGFSLSLLQAWLLLFILISLAWFLWENYKPAIYACLVCSAIFLSIRSVSFYKAGTERKIIVYNSSGRVLIDCISGRQLLTISNKPFMENEIDYVAGPARILFRLIPATKKGLVIRDLKFMNKKILILDKAIQFPAEMIRTRIDILIIAGNARNNIPELFEHLDIKQLLIHSSIPVWNAGVLKKTCDSLKIPRYDLVDKGAFVMKL